MQAIERLTGTLNQVLMVDAFNLKPFQECLEKLTSIRSYRPKPSNPSLNSIWRKMLDDVVAVLIVLFSRLARQSRIIQNYTSDNPQQAVTQHIKDQLATLIDGYVAAKEKELEMCLNCEKLFPSWKMTRHIKVCKATYDLIEHMEQIDLEVAAKLQDMKQEIARVQARQKEKQQERRRSKDITLIGAVRCRQFYNKGFSKTSIYKKKADDLSATSNSDSDKSPAPVPIGPARELKQLSTQELANYMKILDQLRLVGNKIKTMRQSASIQLVEDLRDVKSSVDSKLKTLNIVGSESATSLLKLLLIRMDLMEKQRRLRKQAEKDGTIHQEGSKTPGIIWNEYESFQNKKTQKHQRNRLKYTSRKGCSEEQSSREGSLNKQEVSHKDFKKIKTLGKGRFGQVSLVVKKKTGLRYAMKKVMIQNKDDYTDIKNQNNIFSVISSPFLVKALYTFSEGKFHYFVMEYMPNGDFSQLLDQECRLDEDQARIYIAEVVMALKYLHEQGIIHRDIKPQNIVFDEKRHLKLTDYGLSEAGLIKRKKEQLKNRTLSRFILNEVNSKLEMEKATGGIVGSPYYIAPEILRGGSATALSDWWSLGVLVFHVLVGAPPFLGNNLADVSEKVFEHVIWPECISFGRGPDDITPEAKDLIDNLLELQPEKRLGQHVEDIKDHAFFNGIIWDRLLEQPITVPFSHRESKPDLIEIGSVDSAELTDGGQDMGSQTGRIKLIRRDILDFQTKAKHRQGQNRNNQLREFAKKLRGRPHF